MLFRQLFDADTGSYTYLLADPATGEAVLIDPVAEQVDRDLGLLRELGLELVATLETHVHADHVTGGGPIRNVTGARYGVAASADLDCADMHLSDGDRVPFGSRSLTVRETPGHTDTCLTYVLDDDSMAFTGDALMIRGCGRTDFQAGDAATLYRSVHDKLFTLPDRTLIYPAHDYKGRTASTVGEEKLHNPRLGGGRTIETFVEIMDNLGLANPKRIDVAVPGNKMCGCVDEDDLLVGAERSEAGVLRVTADWVDAHRNEVRLVDVRQPEEYRGPLGHLPEAQLVPLGELEAHAATWSRATPIVLICHSDSRAERGARRLHQMGFVRVACLAGGMLQLRERELRMQAVG